ncbi:phospholipid-binding protein MlaC [Frischella perrara]|uniref:Phospholipid-binding protein MlaC n=1 Tax=Frischella perrara TaxID=1267021 RepID=A0A318MQG9_FRIPE|nr:phospholipid-binding protein MlaC [Frischella perrara]PXY95065.1 phospholipid-binding protein MlaC [Frischella perrara]
MLKKFIVIVTLIFAPIVMAGEKNFEDPYQKTKIAAEKIFNAINQQSAQIKSNPEILRDVVKSDLLPYVHVKYAAALSLGDNYKNINKDERDAYFSAFERYLIQAFAQALSMYNGQSYQVESDKDVTGKNIVSVRVLLINPDKSQQPIRLDFQWRKNTATGEWQAYDMVAEGVSMITTKQSEWSTIVRQQGIKSLIAQLQSQASQKIDPSAIPNKTTASK